MYGTCSDECRTGAARSATVTGCSAPAFSPTNASCFWSPLNGRWLSSVQCLPARPSYNSFADFFSVILVLEPLAATIPNKQQFWNGSPVTFHCCFFYEEVDIFEHVGLLKEILWTILCFVTCAMRVALICPLLSKLDRNYTWNLNCAFWYQQMPGACNKAIWLLCACETSKREVIFISCFVFVWCQHDWTGPCSADLKDGLSLMSTALQSFPTFSLCSNICSLFLWAACLKNCVSSNKTLWNGNLLMYTLQCRPV